MQNIAPPRFAIVVYGHIVGLAVIRALGKAGVPVLVFHYDACEMGRFSRYVTARVRVPSPVDYEERFIEELIRLGPSYRGSVLFPTDDYTLLALARHKAKLSRFYEVVAAEWQTVQVLVDKSLTYKLATRLGIPSPQTYYPRTDEELDHALSSLRFPCLIKPCHGHVFFSRYRQKLFRVDSCEEAYQQYNLLKEQGLNAVLQEYIPGPDSAGINYNVQCKGGDVVAEFTAQKVRVDPPIFGSPRVIQSKKIPEIIEIGRRMMKELCFEGFACVEFKKDSRDGVYKLMEINGRHNLSGSLAVRCGINFPLLTYEQIVNGTAESGSSFDEGIYWVDLLKDVMRFFVSRKVEGYGLTEYFVPYRSKKVFAIWDPFDPIPFLARCFFVLRKTVGVVFETIDSWRSGE